MKLNTKFDLFQEVFVAHDPDQEARWVTEIHIVPAGVIYQLSRGTEMSVHYEQELTAGRDVLKATSQE